MSEPLHSAQRAENRPGIAARTLLVLLRVYQTYLSSMNISACKFYPSCSHYAGEAVQRFGARLGVWLTLKRLGRCQPFTRGGFDPVPDLISDASIPSFTSGVQGGTASAMPFNRLPSGEFSRFLRPDAFGRETPEASSHPPNVRATRGQEFAQ